MNPAFLSDGFLYEGIEAWKSGFSQRGLSVCDELTATRLTLEKQFSTLSARAAWKDARREAAREISMGLSAFSGSLPASLFPTDQERRAVLAPLTRLLALIETQRNALSPALAALLKEEQTYPLLRSKVEGIATGFPAAKRAAEEMLPEALPHLATEEHEYNALAARIKQTADEARTLSASLPAWFSTVTAELPQRLAAAADLSGDGARANPAALSRICGEAIHFLADG